MLVGSPPPSLSAFTSFIFDPRWLYEQLLVKDFTLDSLTVTPKQTNFAAGVDYMTDYDEWLRIQVENIIAKRRRRTVLVYRPAH